jgi:hypothetical protein
MELEAMGTCYFNLIRVYDSCLLLLLIYLCHKLLTASGKVLVYEGNLISKWFADLLHVFSYLPKDLNFIQHTSYIGWKEYGHFIIFGSSLSLNLGLEVIYIVCLSLHPGKDK